MFVGLQENSTGNWWGAGKQKEDMCIYNYIAIIKSELTFYFTNLNLITYTSLIKCKVTL